jgi:hypothetical protein
LTPSLAGSAELFRFLAIGVDVAHAAAMIAWGAGLPLLVWHRYARLSRAYTWFAAVFVVLSVASQWALGECFLTRIAREFWFRGGGFRDGVPFTVLFTNAVAGIRPSTRTAVIIWEAAVLATSVGSLWSFYRHARRDARPSRDRSGSVRPSEPRDQQAC